MARVRVYQPKPENQAYDVVVEGLERQQRYVILPDGLTIPSFVSADDPHVDLPADEVQISDLPAHIAARVADIERQHEAPEPDSGLDL